MALLPTSVTATASGHVAHTNQAHKKLNGGCVDVVADFAADNTGATNCHTQWQSAVTAAEADGVPVYAPPGSYKFGATVNISRPGLRVFGAGWSSSIQLAAATNAYVFTFTPGSSTRMDGVEFSDLRIDCNGGNQSTGGGGINAFGAAYCLFDHLEIVAPYNYGIELHQDNLGGFGHHNTVRTCWVHLGTNSAGVGGKGTGIYMWSSDENHIVGGNVFESNGSAAASGAQIYETSGLNTISGNTFVGNPSQASVEHIKMTGSRNIVTANHFDGGTNAQVECGGDTCSITANDFYQPISNSDCLLVLGRNNAIVANAFTSAVTNNASRSAINAAGASGVNYRWGNVVSTVGTWNGSIYNGNTSTELAVMTG